MKDIIEMMYSKKVITLKEAIEETEEGSLRMLVNITHYVAVYGDSAYVFPMGTKGKPDKTEASKIAFMLAGPLDSMSSKFNEDLKKSLKPMKVGNEKAEEALIMLQIEGPLQEWFVTSKDVLDKINELSIKTASAETGDQEPTVH